MNALLFGRIMQNKHNSPTDNLSRLTAILLGLPWVEVAAEAWKLGRKTLRGLSNEGMYEVLEYESTLELRDAKGKDATFSKRMKVRYQQDDIIAFQDYGWGEGKAIQNYQSSPGVPVDKYKVGYKTYVLLSLREVKNKGDMDEFHIRWGITNGFQTANESWETEISTRMHRVQIHIIFPESRPPDKVIGVEHNVRESRQFHNRAKRRLPDGRWRVTWEIEKPRLFERYVIKWEW